MHALAASTGLVALVEADGKQATVSSSVGFESPATPYLPLSLDHETLLGRSVADRALHTSGALNATTRSFSRTAHRSPGPVGSTVIAPLVAGGRAIAVLSLGFASTGTVER